MYELEATFETETVLYKQTPAPVTGHGWYVKPDWKTRRFSYKVRPAVNNPAVFPISALPEQWPQTDFAPLPARWVKFWYDIGSLQMFGAPFDDLTFDQKAFMRTKMNDIMGGDKAFFNQHDGNGPQPMQESLICAGNMVEILDRRTVNLKRAKDPDGRQWGITEMVRLNSFLIGDMPPPVTLELLSDVRIQRATIVHRDWIGEFPHFGGKPVLFPVITRAYYWYPMCELEYI